MLDNNSFVEKEPKCPFYKRATMTGNAARPRSSESASEALGCSVTLSFFRLAKAGSNGSR